MDYMQQVTEALDKLGATSAEIAQTLANKGIQGRRAAAGSCALAVYVREQFPELTGFSISSQDAGCEEPEQWAVDVSPPIADFVQDFDEGRYPNLVSA